MASERRLKPGSPNIQLTAIAVLKAMYREWPFFKTFVVEHGHGAVEEQHSHCVPLCAGIMQPASNE
jgi:hypothetical protein